ncbi:hypothetical protein HK104_001268 [Borealophlyctis nickersoniae]|nr:hypothetical protein HK104_001268 [Borealophlyctis nickersoniae]
MLHKGSLDPVLLRMKMVVERLEKEDRRNSRYLAKKLANQVHVSSYALPKGPKSVYPSMWLPILETHERDVEGTLKGALTADLPPRLPPLVTDVGEVDAADVEQSSAPVLTIVDQERADRIFDIISASLEDEQEDPEGLLELLMEDRLRELQSMRRNFSGEKPTDLDQASEVFDQQINALLSVFSNEEVASTTQEVDAARRLKRDKFGRIINGRWDFEEERDKLPPIRAVIRERRVWKPGGTLDDTKREAFVKNRERARQIAALFAPRRTTVSQGPPYISSALSSAGGTFPGPIPQMPTRSSSTLPSRSTFSIATHNSLLISRPSTAARSQAELEQEIKILRRPNTGLGERMLRFMEMHSSGTKSLAALGNIEFRDFVTPKPIVDRESYSDHAHVGGESTDSTLHPFANTRTVKEESVFDYQRDETEHFEQTPAPVVDVTAQLAAIPQPVLVPAHHAEADKERASSHGNDQANAAPVPDVPVEPAPKPKRRLARSLVDRPLPDPDELAHVFVKLTESETDPAQAREDDMPLHTVKHTFLNDFVALDARHTAVKDNEAELALRDVNAIGARLVQEVNPLDAVEFVWNLHRYLRTISAPPITPEVSAGMLHIVEFGEDDETRAADMQEIVSDLPRDQYVLLKAIVGHLYRISHLAPYTITRGLSSVFGPLLFTSPNGLRPRPVSKKDDWESAVAAAAAMLQEAQLLGADTTEGPESSGVAPVDGSPRGRRISKASILVRTATDRQLQQLAARVAASLEVPEEGEEDNVDAGEGGGGPREVATPSEGQPPPVVVPPREPRKTSVVPGFRSDFPTTPTLVELPPAPSSHRSSFQAAHIKPHKEEGIPPVAEERETEPDPPPPPGSADSDADRPTSPQDPDSPNGPTRRTMASELFLSQLALPLDATAVEIMINYFDELFGAGQSSAMKIDVEE